MYVYFTLIKNYLLVFFLLYGCCVPPVTLIDFIDIICCGDSPMLWKKKKISYSNLDHRFVRCYVIMNLENFYGSLLTHNLF